MNDFGALGIMVVLLILNALFVAAEFALISVRREQLEPLVQEGKWSARITMKVVREVNLAIAGTQLGITASSIGIGAVGEPALAHLLEIPFAWLGLPEFLLHPVALVIALGIVIYLHMVLAEMVPKNIALSATLPVSLALGPFIYVFCIIVRPFLWLMNAAANAVLKMMRVEPKAEVDAAFDRDQVRSFIEDSGREGLLDEDETWLLAHALDFETSTAADVALPGDQLRTVPDSATIREVEVLAAETGFSRFPVEGARGKYIGYVHVKDLLAAPDPEQSAVPRYLNPLPAIPSDANLRDVVKRMQRSHSHLAVLVAPDDHANGGEVMAAPVGGDADRSAGETRAGLPKPAVVALEDVLEELVGDVRDATTPVEHHTNS